jgi:hypothetical protein
VPRLRPPRLGPRTARSRDDRVTDDPRCFKVGTHSGGFVALLGRGRRDSDTTEPAGGRTPSPAHSGPALGPTDCAGESRSSTRGLPLDVRRVPCLRPPRLRPQAAASRDVRVVLHLCGFKCRPVGRLSLCVGAGPNSPKGAACSRRQGGRRGRVAAVRLPAHLGESPRAERASTRLVAADRAGGPTPSNSFVAALLPTTCTLSVMPSLPGRQRSDRTGDDKRKPVISSERSESRDPQRVRRSLHHSWSRREMERTAKTTGTPRLGRRTPSLGVARVDVIGSQGRAVRRATSRRDPRDDALRRHRSALQRPQASSFRGTPVPPLILSANCL